MAKILIRNGKVSLADLTVTRCNQSEMMCNNVHQSATTLKPHLDVHPNIASDSVTPLPPSHQQAFMGHYFSGVSNVAEFDTDLGHQQARWTL